MPEPPPEATSPYDRDVIFQDNGPIDPTFITEAIRTVMRALPFDPGEPRAWSHRRMFSAMLGLSALNPRDEIEVMLGVQALSAYHAASACWRIGMNLHRPNGDSTRHISAAASAARAFDSMLRALERRQAKPLAVPFGRPTPRLWPATSPTRYVQGLEDRCRLGEDAAPTGNSEPISDTVWTAEDLALADALRERERTEAENAGLDIANTAGILPGGGMILTEQPTPEQEAYMARRLGLVYRREYEENVRNGSKKLPKIRPVRPGDLIP
jgi:hypothetical protein